MSHTSKHKKASVVESFKDIIPLSFGEEIGNAASHGAAALLTLFVLPYAAVHSYNHGGTLESVSVSIYIISIFMMFISSTIYHSMQNYTAHKYILRIIDHSMIYVAISGTYTPVLLTIVGGWIGWVVTLFLWVNSDAFKEAHKNTGKSEDSPVIKSEIVKANVLSKLDK